MSQEHKFKKDEIIKKIQENDPEILGELAEIILAMREKISYKTVNFTDKDLKKMNRELKERFK